MARSTFTYGSTSTVDVADFSRFAKALRRVDPAAYRRMTAALRLTAKAVASEAAQQVASWSTRIPGSIKAHVSGVNASVSAGGSTAPHAAAYENKGKPGEFRHPVFGHFDRWVAQQARPFLAPALAAKSDDVVAGFMGAFDAAIRDAGLI